MQHVPAEYNDVAYFQEVLHLEVNQDDASNMQIDDEDKDEKKEIVVSPIMPTPDIMLRASSRGSDKSNVSIHVRTLSSASLSSSSTAVSSHLSCEMLEEAAYTVRRKKEVMARMDIKIPGHENLNTLNDSSLLSAVTNQLNPTLCVPVNSKPYMWITDRIRTKVFKPRQKKSQEKSSHQKQMSCCVRCREGFENDHSLHVLSCRHSYCKCCLQTLIMQASEDESKMPPRCCTKIIPGTIIASVLKEDDQVKFLKSVSQFRNRLESQILCPNVNCSGLFSEFQPSNSLRPLEVTCCKCNLCICSLCKGPFHSLDTECPSEWARHTIVQLYDDEGQVPQVTKSCVTKTARADMDDHEAQAKVDKKCGYPMSMDSKNSDLILSKKSSKERFAEKEARSNTDRSLQEPSSELTMKDSYNCEEIAMAEKRTLESVELTSLRQRQMNERDRFCAFEHKMKLLMKTRHCEERTQARETHEKRLDKMKQHHKRIAAQLEDVQVAAEFEMISTFKKTEQNVRNRLRHMEAYCDAIGRDTSDSSTEREVTEKDLRQLGQQYNLRDSMYQVHQSKIKVLRDKQAKQMERLLMQQEREVEKFMNRREDITLSEQRFKKEIDGLSELFAKRKSALVRKWDVEELSERRRLESDKSLRFAPMTPIGWPGQEPET